MALTIDRTLAVPATTALFAALTLAPPPTAELVPRVAVLLFFVALAALGKVGTTVPSFSTEVPPHA